MPSKKYRDLKRIFEPERIAIIGVSAEGYGFGSGMLLALNKMKYSGKLFPVNPRGGTIAGMKIHESLDSVPGRIDLGIIAVPAQHVPRAVEECVKKGAAGVEILSAGFRETGTDEGIALEKKLRELASAGANIVGPNCFGIYNPRTGLTLLPGPDLSREPGPVGFISQSGGMAIDLSHIGKWRGIGFSTVVSFGNGAGLRETDILDYFASDPDTRVIAMYIEGINDGRRFFNALKSVCLEKPVIIMKGGLSESGSRAVMSHTASIAGKAEMWKYVIRQCNAVRASDLKEISDLSLAFSTLPGKKYSGISIIGGGGAIGVTGADMAASCGMNVPEFEKPLQEEIVSILPRPGSSAKNPVDVANPMVGPDVLKKALILSARNKAVDAQIIVQLLHHYKPMTMYAPGSTVKDITPTAQFAEAFSEAAAVTGKPVIAVMPDYKQGEESLDIAEMLRNARAYYSKKGIPVFDDIKNAIKSIKAVSDYYSRRR